MADDISSWVGPVIGLGLGLVALKAIDNALNGPNNNRGILGNNRRRRASLYVVYIGNKLHRRYKDFEKAKDAADKLRARGVRDVVVVTE